ncbi:hypothetical protein [Collimonas arenae]|nr:hypothetical protein [Collimonas arenae]
MSMRWTLSDAPEEVEDAPPPIWFFVLLYVIFQLLGIALTIFNWPKNQPTMTAPFWMAMIVLPALAWVAAWGIIYTNHAAYQNKVRWWNFLRECRVKYWRDWTQCREVLFASVALTPEEDLAERMLGLEGQAPTNPDKTLSLASQAEGPDRSRLEQIFERLLTQLAAPIQQLARAPVGPCEVVLQTGAEDSTPVLLRVWQRFKLPGTPKVVWLSSDADSPLVEQWFKGAGAKFRLVIACQLHDERDEQTYSEAAVAMLLTTVEIAAATKLKTQACLFRPITAESDSTDDALATLLRAEQVPVGKIKHLWFSRLDKIVRHATESAVRDAGLTVATHEVDRAMGKPGPINRWLLQVFAAQMVQHGQGAQLVANPHRTGVALNVVGAQPAPPMTTPLPDHVSTLIPLIVALCGIAGFLIVGLRGVSPEPNSDNLFMILLIGMPLLIALRIGVDILDTKLTTSEFDEKYPN